LGHVFADPALLDRALIPSSSADGAAAFERLEFLGDRVLGLRLAERLFADAPQERESELAVRIAELGRKETLAEVARARGLDALLRRDHGAPSDGVLADCVEAVIAALFLDGGYAVAAAFIDAAWAARLAEDGPPAKDPKSTLQEWALARGKPLPAYAILHEDGPAHARLFVAEVRVESEIGPLSAYGEGPAKRAAERAAADALLKQLGAA
ncbi:MAG: ribonuclease III domain-containing protein, partial [Pseudomonadota bacterium]